MLGREERTVRNLVLLGIDVLSVKMKKMLKKSVLISMPAALLELKA